MWRRISNLFKGFFSLFISGLERDNPKALIEAEKENLREQIARFNDNLATHAGFAERLMRQVKKLEKQDHELAAKAAANLKAGNRGVAAQYALQLRTVKEQLEENRIQLEAAEETYKKLVKSRDVAVKEARAKIETLKRMLSETEMLEAQAELQEMASGMISSDRRLRRHPRPGGGVPQRAAGQGRGPGPGGGLDHRHHRGRHDGGGAGRPRRRRAQRVRRGLRHRRAGRGRRGRGRGGATPAKA